MYKIKWTNCRLKLSWDVSYLLSIQVLILKQISVSCSQLDTPFVTCPALCWTCCSVSFALSCFWSIFRVFRFAVLAFNALFMFVNLHFLNSLCEALNVGSLGTMRSITVCLHIWIPLTNKKMLNKNCWCSKMTYYYYVIINSVSI